MYSVTPTPRTPIAAVVSVTNNLYTITTTGPLSPTHANGRYLSKDENGTTCTKSKINMPVCHQIKKKKIICKPLTPGPGYLVVVIPMPLLCLDLLETP